MRKLAVALSVSIVLGGCATQVAISGRFPARHSAAAELRKIAILGFEGRGGREFSSALETELFSAQFDGQRYFTLVNSGGGGGDVDQATEAARYGRSIGAQGVFYGRTMIDFQEQPFQSSRRECVQRDDKKCVRYVDVKIWCRRREVRVTANPTFVRVADSAVVYSAQKSAAQQTSWCQGEGQRVSDEEMVAKARVVILGDIRRDVAPYNAVLQATVKESPEGLSKDLAVQFAAAVKVARAGNIGEACRIWTEIDKASPNHVWTVYDLGVCLEAQGDFAAAGDQYRRAQSLGAAADRQVIASIARVNSLMTAEQQLAAEQRRRDEATAAEQRRVQDAAKARAAADAAARRDAATAQAADAKRKQAATAAAQAARAARRADLVAKYGTPIADAILAGQIKVGMTREQVIASRGPPSSKEALGGGEEMWRYGATKVVFSNGRVTFVR